MSIIPKLATSLGRRDEIPNTELAADIAATLDSSAVKELVDNLGSKNKDIQNDCIKTLYEIGERDPLLISPFLEVFLSLLESKNNRLQWGAMTALNAIAKAVPDKIFLSLPMILSAADKGSVITKDNAFGILISLCCTREFAKEVTPLLNEQLLKSLPNQLPMYAERALPVIGKENKDIFIKTLTLRLEDLAKESGKKRLLIVIDKARRL